MSCMNTSLTNTIKPRADGARALRSNDLVTDLYPFQFTRIHPLKKFSPSIDMVETGQFPMALPTTSALRGNAPLSQNLFSIGNGGSLPLPRFIILNNDQHRGSPHNPDNPDRDARTAISPPLSSSTSISAHTDASTSSTLTHQEPSKKQKSIPPSRRRKPNFAENLHAVLSNKECRDIVSWMPSGRAFIIKNKADFSKKILPKYLRQAKLESFFRRLKRWEFRKVYSSKPGKVVFEHDVFHRDLPELCRTMNGRDTSIQDSEADYEQDHEPQEPLAEIPRLNVPVDDPFHNSSSRRAGISPYSNANVGRFPHRELGCPDFARNNMMSLPRRENPPFVPVRSERLTTMMPSSIRRHTTMNSVPSATISRSMAFSPQLPRPMETARVSMERQPQFNPSNDTSTAAMALAALNNDIQRCEERLAILQKLKILREKRRLLGMDDS
mmetsp:Transcript_3170/g.6426  ORF Transcript_3170/g.6426 Transcript_3170/m.6426 type:complete len:441 (-) Transcript_3170:222-1544(-)